MTIYQVIEYRPRQLFSTLAAVTASNPVLLEGEKWNEKSAATGRFTGRTKTGDGVVAGTAPNQTIVGTAFNDLPFDPAPGGGVSSVTIAPPAGWSSSSSNAGGSITLTLGLPAGFSLPSNASQTTWDTAYTERLQWNGGSTGLNAATGRASLGLAAVASSGAYGDLSGRPTLGTAAATDASAYATAAQGAKADTAVQPAGLASTLIGYVQTGDSRLSDSREWSAATVSQDTAEAGTSTTRVAYNPLRVFQSIAAYIAANFSATGQAMATAVNAAAARTTLGLGTAATAATSDFAAASHNQAASTISDSTATGRAVLIAADAAAARTAIGAGTSSLAISSTAPAALAATAAAGSSTDAARSDHAHQRDTDLLVVNLSGSGSDPTAANTIETFTFTFAAEILASALSSETAASGAAFQANARLNANSIYSVRPQIAIGSTTGSAGTLAITSAAIGDVLRFDISQAGGGCRLAKLYLTIRRTA
jgi:hypothetical protein